MPIRPFGGVQTIVATSQPVFGTVMNGNGSMLTDIHTHNTKPSSQDSQTVLPVTTTVGFRKGDRVLVGPKANFVYQGVVDQGTIFAINPGVSITVQGLVSAHLSGEFVVLNEDVAQVLVLGVTGNTGTIYLGNASTVSATDPSVFDIIAPPAGTGEQTYWHNPPAVGPGAIYKTAEYWIFGTVGDKLLARMVIP